MTHKKKKNKTKTLITEARISIYFNHVSLFCFFKDIIVIAICESKQVFSLIRSISPSLGDMLLVLSKASLESQQLVVL